MTWLVAWPADVTNRYKIRSSGRTSYEHITGHRKLQAIEAFDEKVMFKYTTDKTRRNKMEIEWGTVCFVEPIPEQPTTWSPNVQECYRRQQFDGTMTIRRTTRRS